MSEPQPQVVEVLDAQQLESLRTVVLVVYVLQALSFFVGISALIGVIIDYVKRDDARGTWIESHIRWQIRTFWWSLLWGGIGVITAWAVVGFVILGILYIWIIYRVVKGWLKLMDRKPLPI